MRILRFFVFIGFVTLSSQAQKLEIPDPLESFNRMVFEFNDVVDGMFFNPLANLYNDILPQEIKLRASNFLQYLWTPVSVVNIILQGKQPFTAIKRFVVNTLFGFFGLFDAASELGIPEETEDFGQTLAVWGIESGPYLVIPLLGPSCVRDAVGQGADLFIDPAGRQIAKSAGKKWNTVRWALTLVSNRSQYAGTYDVVKKTSVDLYSAIRSLYAQHRYEKIYDSKPPKEEGPEVYNNDDVL